MVFSFTPLISSFAYFEFCCPLQSKPKTPTIVPSQPRADQRLGCSTYLDPMPNFLQWVQVGTFFGVSSTLISDLIHPTLLGPFRWDTNLTDPTLHTAIRWLIEKEVTSHATWQQNRGGTAPCLQHLFFMLIKSPFKKALRSTAKTQKHKLLDDHHSSLLFQSCVLVILYVRRCATMASCYHVYCYLADTLLLK